VRTAFIQKLCEIAERDERVWLLTGDLGFSVLEVFAERFPKRFVNAGVAEQNMMGVAAGLAFSGKIPFVYSIANFPVMRCLEQIRNDVCCHNANVKIVSVGAGLAYGPAGYTHHAVETLAVMRVLPNMTVVAPADPAEAALATAAAAAHRGPVYLLLGKAGESDVHASPPPFELGKAITVRRGSDAAVITTGGTLKLAVEAAARLEAEGISLAVISMPCVKPLDEKAVLDAADRTNGVITVEEHARGGLGSAAAEVLAGRRCRFKSIRLKDLPVLTAGGQAVLAATGGVSLDRIIDAAREFAKASQ